MGIRNTKDLTVPAPSFGKKWATGTFNLTSGTKTLSGLAFEPSVIVFYAVDASTSPLFMTFVNVKLNPTKMTKSVISEVSQGEYDTYDSTNYGAVYKNTGITVNADGITYTSNYNVNNLEWVAYE